MYLRRRTILSVSLLVVFIGPAYGQQASNEVITLQPEKLECLYVSRRALHAEADFQQNAGKCAENRFVQISEGKSYPE